MTSGRSRREPFHQIYTAEIKEVLKVCLLDLPYHLPAPNDFEIFFGACSHHGLTGGITRQIAKYGHPSPPFVCYAKEMFKQQFFQYAMYQALLEKIHRGLLKESGEVLLLKGAALNRYTYESGVRHMSDLDLFAVEKNRDILLKILCELGFQRPTQSTVFRSPEGMLVDLHGPTIGRTEESCGLEGDRLWRNSTPDPRFPQFRLLAPHDEIGYLGVHCLKHDYQRWVWLWDLWLTMGRIQTPRLLPWKDGVLYAVQCAWFLLQDLLGEAPCPDPGRSLGWLEKRFLRRMVRGGGYHPLGNLLLAWNQPTLKARLFFLRNHLFDRGDVSLDYLLSRFFRQAYLGLSRTWLSLVERDADRPDLGLEE